MSQNFEPIEQIRQLTEENRQLMVKIDELMNSIVLLKEENQQLRDEIAFLKGQKPRPKIPPSRLEGSKSKDKQRLSRGKHPRKNKKAVVTIHEEQIIQPPEIPSGAKFKGYKYYTVQDIIFKPHNTLYKIARWELPDGNYLSGLLPNGVHGHYGPELIVYILEQHYHSRVPEPLLLTQLCARGIHISAGQLNNILVQGKEAFHQEKDELLTAGIQAHSQIQVDDTGGRHKGKNQYTTVIGNKWFSVFTTTESKSRINFFRLLQNGKHEYLINEDTRTYLEAMKAPSHLISYIMLSNGNKFISREAWEKFLKDRNIINESEQQMITEGALCASVIENGIPRDLGVHGDDAGQFNAFIRSLCWIHEERHYRKIVASSDTIRIELEQVRDQIWALYNELKQYQQNPHPEAKLTINRKFDDLFLQKHTSSSTLNKQLRKTYKKKEKLLRVLERPDTPLHNNSSETDARGAVMIRKISSGTRSDEGKKARDTFLSLKQTCRKLRINFISYLGDRVRGLYKIPKLAEVILQKAAACVNKGTAKESYA